MNLAQVVVPGTDYFSFERASAEPVGRRSLEELLRAGDATKRVHFQAEPETRPCGSLTGKIGERSLRILAFVRKSKEPVSGPEICAALSESHPKKVLGFVCILAKRKHLKKSGVRGSFRYEIGQAV